MTSNSDLVKRLRDRARSKWNDHLNGRVLLNAHVKSEKDLLEWEAADAMDAAEVKYREEVKIVAGGPPCPTCGFKIRQSVRPPFVIEED